LQSFTAIAVDTADPLGPLYKHMTVAVRTRPAHDTLQPDNWAADSLQMLIQMTQNHSPGQHSSQSSVSTYFNAVDIKEASNVLY